MDTVPPEVGTPPNSLQDLQNPQKIVHLATRRRLHTAVRKKKSAMDVKVKLENYRSIFNNSPKGSSAEKRALGKMAELVSDLPDDDAEKYEYMRIALDFYDGDEALSAALFKNLLELAPRVESKEEQLKTYRVLLRNKQCDDATKEAVAEKMLEILETV